MFVFGSTFLGGGLALPSQRASCRNIFFLTSGCSQINITAGALRTDSNGTKNKCGLDPFIRQDISKNVGNAARLDHQISNFRIERIIPVGPVVDSVTVFSLFDQIQPDQFFEFLPNGAVIQFGTALNLPAVEFLFPIDEKQSENGSPCT